MTELSHLLAHYTEAILLQLVCFTQQRVERFPHPHVVAGQGRHREGGDLLQSGQWGVQGRGRHEEVGVVHVLGDSL